MNKKILFITHETSRTGAPILLFQFMQWLKNNKADISFDILAIDGGVLEKEFKNVCSTYYNYTEYTKPKQLTLKDQILKKFKLFKTVNLKHKLIEELITSHYNIVYANTVVCLPLANDIVNKLYKSKLIAHIHELNVMIKKYFPNSSQFRNIVNSCNNVIVPSDIVKKNLIENWQIREEIITKVYEFSNVTAKIKKTKDSKFFKVGASGTVDWRKGYDIFILLANYICKNYPDANIKFEWVGRMTHLMKAIIEEDIKKLNLSDKVEFVDEVVNPLSYFNDMDIFVLTSREDPFPLVCIEVGILGKPIISFENATGTNEILVKGGGFIVPYLDIQTMGEKIMLYYNNRHLINEHGLINEDNFSVFTPELVSPQLFSILESI